MKTLKELQFGPALLIGQDLLQLKSESTSDFFSSYFSPLVTDPTTKILGSGGHSNPLFLTKICSVVWAKDPRGLVLASRGSDLRLGDVSSFYLCFKRSEV